MIPMLTDDEGATLLALARAAIEQRLFENDVLSTMRATMALTPALAELRACFVTLKLPDASGGLQLRGCVGSVEARRPAHEAIVDAAREAAFSDPRFPPLTTDEYPDLVLSISVLTAMSPVESHEAIVVGRDGVALETSAGSALFLPEVAVENGWTREVLLAQLARKAGLPAEAWRRARLSTFQSQGFGEPRGEAARIRRS